MRYLAEVWVIAVALSLGCGASSAPYSAPPPLDLGDAAFDRALGGLRQAGLEIATADRARNTITTKWERAGRFDVRWLVFIKDGRVSIESECEVSMNVPCESQPVGREQQARNILRRIEREPIPSTPDAGIVNPVEMTGMVGEHPNRRDVDASVADAAIAGVRDADDRPALADKYTPFYEEGILVVPVKTPFWCVTNDKASLRGACWESRSRCGKFDGCAEREAFSCVKGIDVTSGRPSAICLIDYQRCLQVRAVLLRDANVRDVGDCVVMRVVK